MKQKGADPFSVPFTPDGEALVACIRREGTPRRVHNLELFLDEEVQDTICARYGLEEALAPGDPYFAEKRQIALQRFLGYDYVCAGPEVVGYVYHQSAAADTAANRRATGRLYMEEHRGPITSWEEFEKYPWPDRSPATTRALEWYEKNLPDDMCLIGTGPGGYAEHLTWLMGYETLCYALYDQRDLVQAICRRVDEIAESR